MPTFDTDSGNDTCMSCGVTTGNLALSPGVVCLDCWAEAAADNPEREGQDRYIAEFYS